MITSLSSRPATTPILTALRRISTLQNAAKRPLCVQGRRSLIHRPVFVRTLSTQPAIADSPSPGKIATTFEPWWSGEEIAAGIEAGTVRYGRLHVPAFETGQASVELDADDDGRRVRVKVPGFMARNRAVHGDRVAVRLMWKAYKRDDSGSDGTGEDEASVGRVEDARARVVAVVRRSEVPVVGVARPGETKIQPRDQRLPAMDLIHPFSQVEEGAHLVACEIVDWDETSVNPKCKMVYHLGPVGSGVAEHRAIMERYGLTSQEYSEDIEGALRERLPSSEAVVEEVRRGNGPRRWDLRKSHRVISIDPPTARDLDDALSVEVKPDGRLRIGVHVADVSHFVPAHSHLDKEAARRSTTVYMPHKTYPMLPRHLSENLCSLLPGEDRLAFSVFFTLDSATGSLCGDDPVAFGKSIIRSSARLSYDEVDAAMARGPSEVSQIDPKVMADVELLWDVAAKRSISRTDDTVRVGSSKMRFEFASADSFSPTKCWSESPSDSPAPNSHSLIEEFMVLANRLVAERLVEGIDMNCKSPPPILRQHPNTEAQVVETILPILQRGCPDHDWTSERWHGRRLAALLEEARKILPDPCFKALSFEAMVAFQMAQYVVVTDPEEDDTAHWALGLGRYMHFTSPIRRYADVLVHRLLTDLVCEGASVYKHSVDELIGATARCNQIRKGSLEADRECAYYFFSDYVRANYSENGMNLNDLVVTKIFPGKEIAKGKFTKDAIEVFVPLVGYSKSVSLEQIGVEKTEKITQDSVTFLREGRVVEWKTLSVVSMNVVCPSGDDSVLKHWTLRLPAASSAEKSSECAEEGVSKSIQRPSECGGNRNSSEEGKHKGIQKLSKGGKKGAPQNVRESSECREEVSKSIPKPAGGGKKSGGIRKSSECASTVPPPPPPPPSSPPVNGSIRPVLPLLPHGPAFAVLRTRLERSVRESNPGASIAARK